MTTPPNVLSAAQLTDHLRAWLRARPECAETIATALAYETAALFALHAPSVANAETLVDAWAEDMKEQIRRLGIGIEHP